MLIQHSTREIRKGCKDCGRTDLYWAHDTERTAMQEPCDDKGCTERNGATITGRMILIEKDGYTIHRTLCTGKLEPVSAPVTAAAQEPLSVSVPPVFVSPAPVEPVGNPDELGAMLEALRKLLGAGVDQEAIRVQVEAITEARLDNYSDGFRRYVDDLVAQIVHPTTTVVVNAQTAQTTTVAGDTHYQLADLIGFLEDGHVYLCGPAGTGKTHMAETASVARKGAGKFAAISLTLQTMKSELAGFVGPDGEYHRTSFRDAVEFGWDYLCDEIDHGHPNTVGFANAATSNKFVGFPDGMVKVHPEFRVIAAANTFGKGQNQLHTGATTLDAATLNRFGQIEIFYDEALENSQVAATGLDSTTQAKLLRFVRAIRLNALAHPEFKVVASPRNSVRIAAALVRGVDWDKAVKVHLTASIQKDHLEKLIG